MSKKMECKFCKLESMYMKNHMVVHLGYKMNNGKMQGGGIVLMCWARVKALLFSSSGMWPAILDEILDEILDDYVEDGGRRCG